MSRNSSHEGKREALLFVIIDLPHRNLRYLRPMKENRACVLYLPSYSRHIFRHVTDRRDNESTHGINVFHVSNFSLDISSWRDESWINAALPRLCLSAIIYTRFSASLELHLTRILNFPIDIPVSRAYSDRFVHASVHRVRH